jgi:ubiquinone/menaquinone biosynthesis C-methylase UbiE
MTQVLAIIPEMNEPKILDIGCGTGVLDVWLAVTIFLTLKFKSIFAFPEEAQSPACSGRRKIKITRYI